ncbi:hypothetical protein JGB26_01150 [Streptomyces flavofungini]|uniref:Uncharacterized protein n=1 Tax=Streptomyces flavofungini TaxID=68200 RepID=A0ABS0WXT2_9ACTN|nr:hypothetical protein [Streptomyces flavofungini]
MKGARLGLRLGLGEPRGSYAVAGVVGGVLQMFRRLAVALVAVLLVTLVVKKPPGAFVKGGVAVAVVLALFALKLTWARATARFGIRRCYVCTGGLVVTNLLGGVRDAVAWRDVTVLNRTATLSLWMTFHRFEIARNGAAPLAFLALGGNPDLAVALPNQAARNGIRP